MHGENSKQQAEELRTAGAGRTVTAGARRNCEPQVRTERTANSRCARRTVDVQEVPTERTTNSKSARETKENHKLFWFWWLSTVTCQSEPAQATAPETTKDWSHTPNLEIPQQKCGVGCPPPTPPPPTKKVLATDLKQLFWSETFAQDENCWFRSKTSCFRLKLRT